ncbi:DUF6565 domain-containing protein [Pontibacter beigongshangensis]|uniref:DUF6565 domain-containing protein n=1 Tax=Pontibacter beigongshangensis TaxID=2574733 RepID=UPI0016505D49|nr:DUF6565 domain-containing protein [Pontibacter beigongshangensis]
MKNFSSFTFPVLLCLLLVSSCALTREQRLQNDFDDFRAWISNLGQQLEHQSEESWQQASAEFSARTTSLDEQQQHLTRELKEEYQALKAQFAELEEEQAQLRIKNKWRTDLLEDAADISAITAGSLWQAYATFMSNVRLRCANWEDEDWRMAHEVYQQLARRQDEVAAGITTEDEVRIKALQMEYHALRTGADEDEDKVTGTEPETES